jgi:hypothetical protein
LYRKLQSQEMAIARESDRSVAVSSAARLANAYRTQPNHGLEMVVFGVIVLTAIWPMLLLADAMATPGHHARSSR